MKICPKCQQVRCNFQGEAVFCSIDEIKLEEMRPAVNVVVDYATR